MCIEAFILISVIFYNTCTNILMSSYTGLIYLVLVGFIISLNDSDIYVGFLWVIDLGVGLVFFIFVLHFTSFLYQKSELSLKQRFDIFSYGIAAFTASLSYYLPTYTDTGFGGDLTKV